MTDPMNIGTADLTRTEQLFREALVGLADRPIVKILELGTLRWDPKFPTHHRAWKPSAAWTMSDVTAGPDVDVVADAHDLRAFGDASQDAVIAVSLWEHLQRPWIAAEAVARVLRPGGIVYVATHQTFPLHGYPDDYFRFSQEALRLLFEDAGLEVVHTAYAYRCTIEPPAEVTRWNRAPDVESWLNVDLYARKPACA